MRRWNGKYAMIGKCLAVVLILIFAFNSLFSSVVYAKPNKADRTPPSAPLNLVATSITDSSVQLSWTASTDNVAVKYYEIYKNSVLAGTTTALGYQVNGLSPSTNYSFYVKAMDTVGNRSKSSKIVYVTTDTYNSDTYTDTDPGTECNTNTDSSSYPDSDYSCTEGDWLLCCMGCLFRFYAG